MLSHIIALIVCLNSYKRGILEISNDFLTANDVDLIRPTCMHCLRTAWR